MEIENLHATFDALIAEEAKVIRYLAKHFTETVERVEASVRHTWYSGNVNGLGLFNASLIMDKITSGHRKGRKLKQKPASDNYTVYELDGEMKPLRMCHYTEYGLDVAYYFVEYNGALFAVPTSDDTKYVMYPTYTYKMEYREGEIWKFAMIDYSSVWQEVYDYSTEAELGYVSCLQYYYVPGLCKRGLYSFPPGCKVYPLQVWSAKIFRQGTTVNRILYYKFSETGEEELIYEYEKKVGRDSLSGRCFRN